MGSRPTNCRDNQTGAPGFLLPYGDSEPESAPEANSAEELIGEIGLVLVVILGIVDVVNMILSAAHIS